MTPASDAVQPKVRSMLVAVALAGVTLGTGFPAVSAAEPSTPSGQMPPAIRVVTAQMSELVETLSVTGTIVARQEAAAGTDLNGLIILSLRADEGDTVEKGQVLAVLDRSTLETQLAQLEASRAQAEASIAQGRAQISDAQIGVRQAEEALQRATTLQGKGFATEAERDNAVNAYDSARARLVAAEKALAAFQAQVGVIDAQTRNIRLQIEKTEVRAPADGLVLSRDATLGGIVSALGAPLFRIAIDAEFELAADVAETALPRLAPDMPVKVDLPGASTPIGGRIRRIAPEVDRGTRLGSIRITLDPVGGARGGNFARGEIEIARRQGVAVPASALIFRGNEAFLQRVEGGKVATVPVKVGARAGSLAEIADGLREGQEVVARAGTFVADGDVITPVRVD